MTDSTFTNKKNFLTGDSACSLILFLIVFLAISDKSHADEVYKNNAKANKLYSKKLFDSSLTLYEKASLADPSDKKLFYNKANAQYRLKKFDQALENYQVAQSDTSRDVRAAAYFNAGNAYAALAQSQIQSQQQGAQENLVKSRDSYIQSLKLRPQDEDAKWNLQKIQHLLKQLQQQEKKQNEKDQQNKDQNKKDEQNKEQNKNDQKNDNKDQSQDKKQQQDESQKKEQDSTDQNKNRNDQSDEKQDSSRTSQTAKQDSMKNEMQMQKALQLIQQYSDDDKQLNKPVQKKKQPAGKPKKDW